MPPGLALPLLFAFLAVEALRAWTLATLGRRWTIRVVVLPGETPVARGPYRFLRHPNYVVVALEAVLLPLWLGCFWTLGLTALPHALALERRIRREEQAWRSLAGHPLGVK
jgi:methyltransferase